MKCQHKHILPVKSCFIISSVPACLFLLFFCSVVNASNKTSMPVSETRYVDIFEMIETQTKANYEKISSWQGKMDILEKDDHYGDNASKTTFIDQDSPAAKSKHIRRTVAAPVDFACDLIDDKLYSNFEPQMKYKAVDLNLNAPTIETVGYTRIRSIVTSEEYMHYEPDLRFAPEDSLILSGGVTGKAAYREPPENAKDRFGGNIRDPRRYFNYKENEKIWLTLSNQRNNLVNMGNVTIASQPHVSIAETDLNGHKQYHISTVYRTSLDDENEHVIIQVVVDSSVDYNVISYTAIQRGITRISVNLTYEKIGDIFVPKTYSKTVLDSEGKRVFDSQVTLTNSIINEPIPEKTFTYENLGLENDVRFVDTIKKLEYWYRNGELVLASAMVDEVVQELIEEMGTEPHNNGDASNKEMISKETDITTLRRLFIPEVGAASKYNKPFIFDMGNSELINVAMKGKLDTEQIRNHLVGLGKGDIAWNGSLITLRSAKALTVKQESHRPLEFAAGTWVKIYNLPKKVELPYPVLVVTKEGLHYLVNIREIKSDGIEIDCRRLNKEEIRHYKQ